MRKRRIEVNDRMQSNYVYFCTEPAGRNFDPEFLQRALDYGAGKNNICRHHVAL
jgi:hypothetical protein